MLKHIVQYSIIAVLAGLLVWGIFWARGKAGGETCAKVVVDISNADSISFVTRDGILDELRRNNVHLLGERMGAINTDKVEAVLRASEYLENVNCYKAQNGKVVISVTQLVPVLRVFDGGTSYYVNARGKRMQAIANYHADVPIVEGHFTKDFTPQRILPMIDYVNGDRVLSSLVSMYCIKDSNDIFVVPTIKGHVVNMGNADGYENKFKKLLLFYRKVMPVKGWMTYDTVSVKWTHQVVATKRARAVVQDEVYDASLDEPMADMQTMSVGDTNQTLAVKKDTSKPDTTHHSKAKDDANDKKADTKEKKQEAKNKKADAEVKKPATASDKKKTATAAEKKKADGKTVQTETKDKKNKNDKNSKDGKNKNKSKSN